MANAPTLHAKQLKSHESNNDVNVDDDSLRGDSFLSTEPLGHWPKGEKQLKLYRTRIARIHAAWTRVGPPESTC